MPRRYAPACLGQLPLLLPSRPPSSKPPPAATARRITAPHCARTDAGQPAPHCAPDSAPCSPRRKRISMRCASLSAADMPQFSSFTAPQWSPCSHPVGTAAASVESPGCSDGCGAPLRWRHPDLPRPRPHQPLLHLRQQAVRVHRGAAGATRQFDGFAQGLRRGRARGAAGGGRAEWCPGTAMRHPQARHCLHRLPGAPPQRQAACTQGSVHSSSANKRTNDKNKRTNNDTQRTNNVHPPRAPRCTALRPHAMPMRSQEPSTSTHPNTQRTHNVRTLSPLLPAARCSAPSGPCPCAATAPCCSAAAPARARRWLCRPAREAEGLRRMRCNEHAIQRETGERGGTRACGVEQARGGCSASACAWLARPSCKARAGVGSVTLRPTCEGAPCLPLGGAAAATRTPAATHMVLALDSLGGVLALPNRDFKRVPLQMGRRAVPAVPAPAAPLLPIPSPAVPIDVPAGLPVTPGTAPGRQAGLRLAQAVAQARLLAAREGGGGEEKAGQARRWGGAQFEPAPAAKPLSLPGASHPRLFRIDFQTSTFDEPPLPPSNPTDAHTPTSNSACALR